MPLNARPLSDTVSIACEPLRLMWRDRWKERGEGEEVRGSVEEAQRETRRRGGETRKEKGEMRRG